MSSNSNATLQAGQFIGSYELSSLVDRRKAIEVWKGRHIRLHRSAALKILQLAKVTATDRQKNERHLYNEALALSSLHHPHIVRFRDYVQVDHFHAMIIEYAPYGSIARHYIKGKLLPLSLIRLYTWQIGHALYTLHQRGVIHRDVKPGNLLLLHPRHVLLADFGLAMRTPTQGIYKGGTASYMAPEQYRGHPCPASDQYGLAASVYCWLTGHRPFYGDTELIMRRRYTPFPVSKFRPELPRDLDDVIQTALHPDPEQRYASVLDFARDLVEVTHVVDPTAVRYRTAHCASLSDWPERESAYHQTQPEIYRLRPTL